MVQEINKNMIKKLIFLLNGLFPLVVVLSALPGGAFAAAVGDYIYCNQDNAGRWVCDPMSSEPSVGSDGNLTGVDTTNNSVVILSGSGLVVQTGGLTVTENIYIEGISGGTSPADPDGKGMLDIENTSNAAFNITSGGAVSVTGRLDIGGGRTLNLQGAAGTPINASFGSITNNGILTISNIDTLTSGQIASLGDASFSANQMTLGAVANNGGNMDIASANSLAMTQFVSSSSGTSAITAGSIDSGDIQNNIGTMNIVMTGAGASGYLNSTGSILNSGGLMTIAGGAVTVAGTMKNDSNIGVMRMNVASLRINGGDASNPSFVNRGDLYLTVAGETYLEYGFDLSAMQKTNEFSLDTNTLTFGTSVLPDFWIQFYSNNLDLFALKIRGGILTANGIVNNTGTNQNAAMDLSAKSISADSVANNAIYNDGGTTSDTTDDTGWLRLTATDAGGGISITGAVSGTAGSKTDIVSSGALQIGGAVANYGTMTLNGNIITLNSVANEGNLKISSLTDATGSIAIASGVTNTTGATYINARQIDIYGALTNNSGTTTVRGSDSNGGSIEIGSINVIGGVVNLDSLIGSIAVDKTITVSGGSLNFGVNTTSVTVGDTITISGDLTLSSTDAVAGGINIANIGTDFSMISAGGNITISGNISATANDFARKVIFDAKDTITIGDASYSGSGNVTAAGQGYLTFGAVSANHLKVFGDLISNVGGTIVLNIDDVNVGSLSGTGKFIVKGQGIEATKAIDNAINIQNGLWFDGSNLGATQGMIVTGTNNLTLTASGNGADINIAGGMAIGGGNTLTLTSNDQITVSGLVAVGGVLDVNAGGAASFANVINNTGTLTIDGASITANGITNSGAATLNTASALQTGSIANSGAMVAIADSIVATAISSTAGSLDFTADSLDMTLLSLTGGYANLNIDKINATGNISATGDLAQGGTTGMLNLTRNNTILIADNLTIGGNFAAIKNAVAYDIQNTFGVTGNMDVANAAAVIVIADTITVDDVTNNGNLSLFGDGIALGDVINNGTLTLISGTTNVMTMNSFTTKAGSSATLIGLGLNSAGDILLAGKLLQNASGTIGGGDVNVAAANYVMIGDSMMMAGIDQTSGKMILNTSDLDVSGSILATDLRVAAQGGDWLTVDVSGSVSGSVDFIGLEHMTVGGNYIFDDNSIIMAAILDRNGVSHNYWATVSLADDNTLGQITNGVNAEPLISINGKFVSDMSQNNPNMYYDWNNGAVGEILDGQIGAYITDIVDQGTAIWLIHADGGIEDKNKK
ncbi:MAG: hypothetical protein LBF28_03585, partial [Rickettsiales bacterium]|nr:hypothetical protein [Rickettsiales bacterium]